MLGCCCCGLSHRTCGAPVCMKIKAPPASLRLHAPSKVYSHIKQVGLHLANKAAIKENPNILDDQRRAAAAASGVRAKINQCRSYLVLHLQLVLVCLLGGQGGTNFLPTAHIMLHPPSCDCPHNHPSCRSLMTCNTQHVQEAAQGDSSAPHVFTTQGYPLCTNLVAGCPPT